MFHVHQFVFVHIRKLIENNISDLNTHFFDGEYHDPCDLFSVLVQELRDDGIDIFKFKVMTLYELTSTIFRPIYLCILN